MARHEARPYTTAWRQFGDHWPYTTPMRLQEYCDQHCYPLKIYTPQDCSPGALYPISIGFFDFSIDYISLLADWVRNLVSKKHIRLLFYYHEGDNPHNIKSRLDQCCQDNGLATDCYVFISSNSQAAKIKNFVYFNDFELWYYQRNVSVPACEVTADSRHFDFLCLSRLHKSWRAVAMAHLVQQGVLTNSVWSYCNTPDQPESFQDCAIEIDRFSQLRWYTAKFLADAPYLADNLSDSERNDHSHLVMDHFASTFCNIVLESQFDVDHSGGVFVTEKTFKPIKHGQLFFVAGAAGTLGHLRRLGYHTFDDILDTSYDLELDHTLRWQIFVECVAKAKATGLQKLHSEAIESIRHNQQLFCASKRDRLNTLAKELHEG